MHNLQAYGRTRTGTHMAAHAQVLEEGMAAQRIAAEASATAATALFKGTHTQTTLHTPHNDTHTQRCAHLAHARHTPIRIATTTSNADPNRLCVGGYACSREREREREKYTNGTHTHIKSDVRVVPALTLTLACSHSLSHAHSQSLSQL
jgi:hypothetical protein